ncbi:hypothetical protein PMAYCL1PPCAC_25475, partial [Pristionchus mayeri]
HKSFGSERCTREYFRTYVNAAWQPLTADRILPIPRESQPDPLHERRHGDNKPCEWRTCIDQRTEVFSSHRFSLLPADASHTPSQCSSSERDSSASRYI